MAGMFKLIRPLSIIDRRQMPSLLRFYMLEKGGCPPSHQMNVIRRIVESGPILRAQQWEEVKAKILLDGNHLTQFNFDSALIRSCHATRQLNTAKSYYKYLKTLKNPPSNATIANLLRFYHSYYDENSDLEVPDDEIYNLCALFQTGQGYLDAASAETAIMALSLTRNWRMSLEYLSTIRMYAVPSAEIYSAIVEAAFKNQDSNSAWRLLRKMLEEDRKPTIAVYKGFFEFCKSNKMVQLSSYEELLRFMSENELRVSIEIGELFMKAAEESNLIAKKTFIKQCGRCGNCNRPLTPLLIAYDEFILLREKFHDQVLVEGGGCSLITPKEIEGYHQFVKTKGAVDVVIDALSVAYSAGMQHGPQKFSKLLASVVEYFVNHNQHVVLIGRIHMKNWQTPFMDYIYQNSSVFFAENLSLDDPFLLYAVMCHGPNTRFVSRNIMGKHVQKLETQYLQYLFRRWHNNVQYKLSNTDQSNITKLQEPLNFMPVIQKTGLHWHIPVESGIKDTSYVTPISDTWICLNLQEK